MAQVSGACCEAKWVREHLSGSVNGNVHVTVRRQSDGRRRVELCKDCKLYHCPFCLPSVYKPKGDYASVWTHVEIHRMRALKHGEFNIYACNFKCRRERHFHCPYCSKTIINRKQFESHLDKCAELQSYTTDKNIKSAASSQPATTTILLLNYTPLQENISKGQSSAPTHPCKSPAPPDPAAQPKSTAELPQDPKSTSDQPVAPPDPPVPVNHPSILTDQPVKRKGQIFRPADRKIKCPMCNLYLCPKNLRLHKLRKHFCQSTSEKDITAKDHLRSQCIDSLNGIYAVAKSYKSTAVPIHVRKKPGSTQKMACEEDRCDSILDFRRRSGLTDSQCTHLQSVNFCFTHAKREDLRPGVLEEMVSSRLIGKDMAAKCLSHQEQATQSEAPLVTLVNLGGSHCLYLSVFEPKVSQYSKIGRLFVTYTIKRGLWHCRCSQGRMTCIHKSLAKWYLFQTNRELYSSNAKQDLALSLSEVVEDSPGETSTEHLAETVFSLRDKGLKQMANYIYNNKKLPSTLPKEALLCESEVGFEKHLVPFQTVCQECPGHVSLTEPMLISNKARVITLTGVIEENSTFFKNCPNCGMVYRYQEWSEGLHNYNDHIILSLQLCKLLQNSIKNDAVVDGVVEVLEQTVGVKSPQSMEVLQAYVHFEALTSHDCQSGVMMDLYQKGVFNMAGIEIQGLPEILTGEVNAEEFWDSACREIIASSLITRSSTYITTLDDIKEAAVSAVTTPLTPAERKRLSKQRTEECHRALTRYLVKELHPLSTVESPWFREMTKMLNPKYHLPSSDELKNTLMPSWYSEERKRVIKELRQVSQAAVTCDWWTSSYHDHYLTVTLHFIAKGQMKQKVLCTKSVYDAQTDTVEAEEIGGILEEFGVRDKVVGMTGDRAFSMDFAIKKSQLRKLRCFAHKLSLAAQKVYTSNLVTRWASRIRAVVVWIKRSPAAHTILQEKQKLLNLPQDSLVLDVRTRWNSLYLMMERFAEQYPAVQATVTDPQIKQAFEEKRLEMLSDDDHQKAEEFIRMMKPLYTSSLCVSADKSPSCSQIIPILKKLEAHFETQEEDSLFTATLKEKVWGDLSACYKDGDTWRFLQESSALDPRFKNRADSEEIWDRVKNAAVRVATEVANQQEHTVLQDGDADEVSEQNMSSDEALYPKRPRLTSLEELFEEEDRALKSIKAAEKTPTPERVQQEIELYRKLPVVPSSEDVMAWWWKSRDSMPLLSQLSSSYLCIQASSTPRERVFCMSGDAISQERSHILPEQADMQIFLQKNC